VEVRKFRRKVATIEVVQLPTFHGNEANYEREFREVARWSGGDEQWSRVRPIGLGLRHPNKGTMSVAEGDWVAKDDRGAWKISADVLGSGYEEVLEFPAVEFSAETDSDGARWWAISEEDVLAMLRRVAAGEDPDAVYAEAYVNSEHEEVEGDE
jgi:hypothetical protein